MRLQSERLPNPQYCALVQTRGFGHQTRAPVRRLPGPALKGHGDHLLDLRVGNLAGLAGTRRIEQSVQTPIDEALAPLAYRSQRHAQTLRDLRIRLALRTSQHDACAQRQRLRRRTTPCPLHQAVVLFDRQTQWPQRPSCSHIRLPVMTLL